MRDSPESASASEAHVCRSDQLTVRGAKVGFAPRQIRLQSPCDETASIDEHATESVTQRLARVLFRALSVWPA